MVCVVNLRRWSMQPIFCCRPRNLFSTKWNPSYATEYSPQQQIVLQWDWTPRIAFVGQSCSHWTPRNRNCLRELGRQFRFRGVQWEQLWPPKAILGVQSLIITFLEGDVFVLIWVVLQNGIQNAWHGDQKKNSRKYSCKTCLIVQYNTFINMCHMKEDRFPGIHGLIRVWVEIPYDIIMLH